jgi:nicotinate-nucleotide pyrophosphorylase (carboxylating)
VTTKWTLSRPSRRVEGRIYAREPVVASGVTHAAAILRERRVVAQAKADDGQRVPANRSLLTFHGPAQGVLAGERLALNVLGRMCGIATLTRRLQDKVDGVNKRCRVAGTRKTTPGFRSYEKEAIVHGGGETHRYGLYDAVLIKDNHLALIDDLGEALARVRKKAKGLVVEVEVTTIKQAETAAAAQVDWVLIDNQSPLEARKIATATRKIDAEVRIEVSGGITEANIAKYARFADRVSIGLLTHSAPAADVTLDLSPRS